MNRADLEAVSPAPDGRPAENQPQWRRDFPIDWPEDQYLTRREFTKFMVLISAAAAVGQLFIAAHNFRRRRRGEPPITAIITLDRIAIGGIRSFAYPGPDDRCILIRTGEDRFLAYSQRCTHVSCAVIPKPAAGVIECPCHNGVFDLATGRPLAGPPRRPLPRILLERHGDTIYATGVELRSA